MMPRVLRIPLVRRVAARIARAVVGRPGAALGVGFLGACLTAAVLIAPVTLAFDAIERWDRRSFAVVVLTRIVVISAVTGVITGSVLLARRVLGGPSAASWEHTSATLLSGAAAGLVALLGWVCAALTWYLLGPEAGFIASIPACVIPVVAWRALAVQAVHATNLLIHISHRRRCQHCGYPREGLASRACPECGRTP
jgi:hypothetical protein